MTYETPRASKTRSSLPGITRSGIKRWPGLTYLPTSGSNALGSKRLSKHTLKKVFYVMIGTVLVLYLALVISFFQKEDFENLGRMENSLGPSSIRKRSEEWKRTHLAKLRQESEQVSTDILQSIYSRKKSRHDLEDVDIEGMFAKNHKQQKANHPVLQAYFQSHNNNSQTPSHHLSVIEFNQIKSCQDVSNFWPVKENVFDIDPLLPNITHLCPSEDGKFIRFEVKPDLKCQEEARQKKGILPEIDVERIQVKNKTRYRLSPSLDALKEKSIFKTQFICRFEPNGLEILSVYIPQSDDIKSSNGLLFQCPVPSQLVESVRDESSSLFLTIVPIRIPPKFTVSPCQWNWNASAIKKPTQEEDDLILPKIEDSTRWMYIPICSHPAYKHSEISIE